MGRHQNFIATIKEEIMFNKYFMPYFTQQGLACKQTRQIVFAQKLLELRVKFNKPMVITSVCSSRDYNSKIGGIKNSFHIYDHLRYGLLGACAVDVAIKDLTEKGNLLALAWGSGWSKGFHRNFLHLDRRVDYTVQKQTAFCY